MNRKAITAALAIAAMLGAQSSAFAEFADMPTGVMGEAMQNAVANGLITGYEDGTVRPDANISRAQMATILTRAFGAKYNADTTFPDVAADAWYADAVSKAVYMGAFKGDNYGNFNPENPITFQETYTVLARLFGFDYYYTLNSKGEKNYTNKADTAVLDSFADKDSVADWAVENAAGVVQYGGYKGIDNQLMGNAPITRAQFAYIMNELVGTYIDDVSGEVTVDSSKAVMIRAKDVNLAGLKADKNLIIGYSVDTCTLSDAQVSGTTVVYGCIDDPNPSSTDNLKCKISLGGEYQDVRVKSAGIYLDASGAKMKSVRGVKNSRIGMGMFGG